MLCWSSQAELENSWGIDLDKFNDTLWAPDGWDKPVRIPQADELKRQGVASSTDGGTRGETLEGDGEHEEHDGDE